MNKKILLLIIYIMLLCGCSNKKEENMKYDFLGIDFVNGEEHIYFGKNQHFSYYDSSGSPVGDYDLCDSYTIKNDIINIKCDKSLGKIQFKIIDSSKEKLILKIENKEIEFRKNGD